ncbi:MAG: class I SAM-dependent methyltransferase [Rhodospirillales bacterium]
MSNRSLKLDGGLYEYLLSVSLQEPAVMRNLRAVTAQMPASAMQIAPEQGQFMALLARLINARSCLEIGVFTGYSALAVARALPEDGRLIACDISDEYTRVGRPFWEEAGVAERIHLRLGPAQETLDALIKAGEAGAFDFAFIDADKAGYPAYVDRCCELVRPGGLIIIDNVLWSGAVIDDTDNSEDTKAIRALNAALVKDERFDLSMIPVGDGLTLLRRR